MATSTWAPELLHTRRSADAMPRVASSPRPVTARATARPRTENCQPSECSEVRTLRLIATPPFAVSPTATDGSRVQDRLLFGERHKRCRSADARLCRDLPLIWQRGREEGSGRTPSSRHCARRGPVGDVTADMPADGGPQGAPGAVMEQ